jgi:hypothetical protein
LEKIKIYDNLVVKKLITNKMIQLHVMPTFLNRLRDRGWKNISVRGFTNQETQVLVKGSRTLVGIQSIHLDASVDIAAQVADYFRELMSQIKKHGTNIELFLPGGGDIQLPDFFREFCEEEKIRYHLVGLGNYQHYADFL